VDYGEYDGDHRIRIGNIDADSVLDAGSGVLVVLGPNHHHVIGSRPV